MRHLALMIAAILISSPAWAARYELPPHSLLCGDEASMKEAVKAIQMEDAAWLRSLPDCLVTNQAVKAQIVEDQGKAVKIRFWAAGQSAIGYTLYKQLR
jgi:hypothetical protein